MTFSHALSTNNYGPAKFIVDGSAANGTHTTIATALTSASSGDTIFIRPGTYTESITLKAGVNLTAFGSDSSLNGTGKVIISGTCTMTTAGTVTISGIQLQTNSAALIAVTGSAASIVQCNNCYLNCTNTTGISHTSSDSGSRVTLNYCNGDIGTTGITLFVSTSSGNININYSAFSNSGGATTASSMSTGAASITYSSFANAFSTSSVGTISSRNSLFSCTAINTASITTAGTGNSSFNHCQFGGGSASAVSIGSGTTVQLYQCIISSSNTNPITGAGTLDYTGIAFSNGSTTAINTTTQVGGLLQGGVTQAPSAGFIGEQIRGAATSGSPITLTNNTCANIASVSLTAGVWDISCICAIANTGTNTQQQMSISTTSATLQGNLGDQYVAESVVISGAISYLYIPAFRVTITSTTIHYMCATSSFSTGTCTGYGRISATRVG